MAVLSLRLFGGFEARRSSGDVAEIPIRKGQALLAYLALRPGEAVARSKLADLFWSDRGDAQARASLRQTLTVLRKALGPAHAGVLQADRQSVGLDGAGLEVDAVTFQELVAAATPADLDAAVSLCRGELLDGLELAAPGFEAWLEEERRRFDDLLVEALAGLMAHRRAEGATRDAVVLAQRLLTLEPLREDVHRALMVLYADLGQRHAAQQQYRRCRDLLERELSVEPEAETETLYRALLAHDVAGDGPAEHPDSTLIGQRKTEVDVDASPDDRSGRPLPATPDQSWRVRQRGAAVRRVLLTGGIAALVWLTPWPPAFEPLPPDRVALQRFVVLPLAAASVDSLPGVREGVTEPSGLAWLQRAAGPLSEQPLANPPRASGPSRPVSPAPLPIRLTEAPSPAAPPFARPSGMQAGATGSSGLAARDRGARSPPARPLPAEPPTDLSGVLDGVAAAVPAETDLRDEEHRKAEETRAALQREADGRWPEVADSWDLRAVRAFVSRYPEARQAAEARQRVAFLVERQREAQAELNRLGYDAGSVDGIWGARSARAMRAFQADNGLASDGIVSRTSLARLKNAATTMAADAAPPPSPMPTTATPELRPSRAVPEVSAVQTQARQGNPEVDRWTAAGYSGDGSMILATATRHGDGLKVVFDIRHQLTPKGYSRKYTQSCTSSFADFDCWILGRIEQTFPAQIYGTFPRLIFSFDNHKLQRYPLPLPKRIVLDFEPETQISLY